MANTGKKITTSLKLVYQINNAPIGPTKPNDINDPDYIPPVIDTVSCPTTINLVCPTSAILTISGSNVYLEMSLPSSIIYNTSIAKIRFSLINVSTSVSNFEMNLPNPTNNYFRNFFGSVPPGTHFLRLEYIDSSNTVLTTCNLNSITITIP